MRLTCRPLLVALALLTPAAPRPAALDEAGFSAACAARLRAAVPGAEVKATAPLEIAWTPPGENEPLRLFLDNAWREYQADPTHLDAVLGRMVGMAVEARQHREQPLDRRRIVPVIKDRAWLEETGRTLRARGQKSPETVREDYNQELVILYAEDREKGIAYLTPETVKRAGLARAELRALAVRNLVPLLPPIEVVGRDGIHMVVAGGDYEASLLLVDDLWTGEKVAPKVKGEVVVAVPARDLLFFVGSEDASAVARLRQIARRARAEASYALTDQLFVRRGGKFVPYR